MSLKPIRIFLPVLLSVSIQSFCFAQENAAFIQPQLDSRLAGDLYRMKDYGYAREMYHKVAANITIDEPEIITSAKFHEAITAAELKNLDAPALIDNFIDTYPENAYYSEASIYLGKIYFKDNKYRDAIKALENVDISGLSRADKEEIYFMIGYSQLKSDNMTAARAYFQRIGNQKSVYYNQARYYLAHIDYSQGKYKQALKGFEGLESDRRYQQAIPLYQIQIYYYLGDDDKIMAMGPAMVENSGTVNKAEIARITGNAFFNAGDYEKAAKYLAIYEEANKRSLGREDYYLLGFVNYKAGDYKAAIPNFQQAIRQKDTLSQNAGYYLGVCYNETDQKKYAANAFLSAYKNGLDPELTEESLFDYIKINLESPSNPYNESISLLESYLKEHPNSPRADEGFGYLSQLYLSSRNYKQALASMESVGKKNPQMQAAYQKILFNRAAELYNMQELNEAMDLYKKASEQSSDLMIKAESLYWIGEIFYQQKNYWAALEYYSDFLEAKQAKKSPYFTIAYYDQGYCNFNRKEYPDAITRFNKFISVAKAEDSKLVTDAYLRIGDAWFISNQYDKAIASYDKAIMAQDASLDYALFQKALSEGAKGDYNEKIKVLKVLINNYPGSSLRDDALYEIALSYVLLNEEDQALTYYDKLIQLYPNTTKAIQASLRKGFIYFNRSDYKQAISSFKSVIEKYPGTQESQEALAALKNIYIETGDVDQYYAYAKGLSFAEVNATEEDSLNYEVAENYYMQGKCDPAISAFTKYIDGFANGSFVTNALYYRSQCYLKSDQKNLALEDMKKVAGRPLSRFTEPAVATAASMEYSSGNYTGALPLFEQLETVAEDPDNTVAALAGQMRCHDKAGDYPATILAARKLLALKNIQADLANEAHFLLGQSYFAQNNLEQAQQEYLITSKLAGTENGAEASYKLALIAYQTGKLADAEERVYALSDHFSAYDYWVAKGFILLSDVFVKEGNEFQARQTLQSVIDNYVGPDLGDVAREKLKALDAKQQQREQQQ